MFLLDAFYKTSRLKIILTQGIGGSIELNIFVIQIPGVFQQFFFRPIPRTYFCVLPTDGAALIYC